MKILLIGKRASITHWLEDAAAAFRAEGHVVREAIVRRPWLSARVETAFAEPLAEATAKSAARFAPDLILAVGGYHAPKPFLRRLSASPGRPPLVGLVGDLFDEAAREAAALYDLVAYTDSGLLARHASLGFASRAIFLPHAANLAAAPAPAPRASRMVFVGNATPGRRAVVEAIAAPVTVCGPGWSRMAPHDIHAGRIAHAEVAGLYARHLAALNVRNEKNVLFGLNQRSFDPCLSATPLVTDDQADLERCFEPGSEVVVWREAAELNAAYDRLRRFPEEAARIGEAGRRRVLAEHGYAHRLAALMAAL
ncbi:MAG TPA: glycosyltransferase [Caulobacteraceae bacterium]|nr:glycosyltransferase [Caulobacteraceae bacterium]